MSSQKTAGSFIRGATILTAAGILSRILGLFFKVPLYHMYGSYGNGIFYNVTNIYNFLLMVSTVGLPVAISKMVSENLAVKDYRAAKDTFIVSLKTLLTVGGVSSLLLLFGAQAIINITDWPQDSFWSIIAIAPAPLLVSACCAYRGYYQGFQIMNPTAISQIFEQIVRVVIGLLVCWYGVYILNDIGIGVAGSVFGATAGAVAALAILMSVYPLFKRREKRIFARAEKDPLKKTSKELFLRLLYIAIPVTLTSSISSLFAVIDSSIYIPRMALAGIDADIATQMIGDLGNAELLVHVPLVISGNLAVAFMPAISESFALKEHRLLNDRINIAIQILVLIGLPCCIGMSTLAYGISDVLFPGSECGYYLTVYAYVAMLMMLSGTFQSVLQGIDRFKIPLITLGIGAIIRFLSAYILLAIPAINLYGIIYAGLITFVFLTVSNYLFIKKYCDFKVEWKNIFFMALSSIVMGALVYGTYYLVKLILPGSLIGSYTLSSAIALVLSVIVGIAVYFVMITVTGCLTPELLDSLPMSGKIWPVYKKIRKVFKRDEE